MASSKASAPLRRQVLQRNHLNMDSSSERNHRRADSSVGKDLVALKMECIHKMKSNLHTIRVCISQRRLVVSLGHSIEGAVQTLLLLFGSLMSLGPSCGVTCDITSANMHHRIYSAKSLPDSSLASHRINHKRSLITSWHSFRSTKIGRWL